MRSCPQTTRGCVNLVALTSSFCVIEADFSSISSMLDLAVRCWNACLPNLVNERQVSPLSHSRSPILVPIESSYATSYWRIMLSYILSRTVSRLLQITGQIFCFRFLIYRTTKLETKVSKRNYCRLFSVK